MHDESLSALLDGELSRREIPALLEALERSPELKSRLSRWALAGEAQRARRIAPQDLDLSSRVMAELEREPSQSPALGRRLQQQWRPLIGLAAAASIALAAVLITARSPESSPFTGATPASWAAGGALQPVSSRTRTVTTVPVAGGEFDQQLAAYLRDHDRYRMLRGVGPHGAYRYGEAIDKPSRDR